MALDAYQQAHTYLGNSKNVLIVAGHTEIEDALPASLALARALSRSKKAITFFTSATIPETFYFLQNEYAPRKTIASSRDVVISLDASKKPVRHIRSDREGNELRVRITPEPGTRIEEQDIHINLAKFTHDLIITFGLDDLESLGEEFEKNASFFFETPIVNIDKNPSNERYGQVNIIEPTLSSCAEIAANLLRKWSEELITREIATPLLCGIIAATNNFQNSRTKPSTLYEAAHLMSREADQQEIIKNLFKTKPLEFLKLLGIAMSKLQYRNDVKLIWFSLAKEDFRESGATPKIIPAILTELKNNFAGATSFVVFWEDPGQAASSRALVHTLQAEHVKALFQSIGGERHGNSLFFRSLANESGAPASPELQRGEQKKFLDTVSYAFKQIAIQ